MKIGAKRMAYPNEGGPKYMQQWTGEKWICFVHIPRLDTESGQIRCKQCGEYICDNDGVRRKP